MIPPARSAIGPRAAIAAAGWSLAFLVFTFLGAGLLTLAAGPRWYRGVGPAPLLLEGAALLAAGLGFTGLIGGWANRLGPRDLRYVGTGNPLAGGAAGLALGAGAAALALLLAVGIGGAAWGPDSGTPALYAEQVARTTLVLAPAALAEEVVFRGVPLVLLDRTVGRRTAIVAVAALFALAHGLNPHVSALGLANIGLAGGFLSLAFFAPGGIWTAFGAHLGWNATLAALDAPVSGLPFRIPLLDYHPGGHAWLTGGAFGPEGGLTATAALALACLVLLRRRPGGTIREGAA